LEVLEGEPDGAGLRVGVVCSRFNGEVTSKLLDGALAALREAGVRERDVVVVHVPGAFELPLAARRLAKARKLDAVVALGAVIRGETDHYDYVCGAAQQGILGVGLELDLPVLFGVLTCETDEQASDRAGGSHGNKGADVAVAAVRLARLFRRLRRPAGRRR
jgi:6,7-dimethyl-8-ribityllumazine synthase